MKRIFLIIILFLFLCNTNTVYAITNEKTDSLLNVLKKSESDTFKVAIYNKLSWLYLQKDFVQSLKYADSALILSKQISFNKGIALSYTHKTYAQIRLGKYDEALININKALTVYEIIGDKGAVAKNYATIAHIYYSKQNYQKAVEYTLKSIEIREKNNISDNLEINYMTLGVIYTEQGKYEEALKMFIKSSEYCEKNNNINSLASNYNNIAIVYRNLNDNISAIENYTKALDIYEKTNDKFGKLKILNNLAVVYEKEENIKKAEEFYDKALQLSKEINYPKGIARTLANLAGINLKNKDYKRAKEKLEEAAKIYSDINDNYGITNVNLLRGQMYFETGNYKEAIIYIKTAFDNAEKSGLLNHKASAAKQLSSVYENISDYKKSLEYFKIYHNTNDSIFNIEKTSVIEEMKNRFETEAREKELKIQKQKIKILEAKQKIQNVTNYFKIAVILLILLIVIIIIVRLKRRIKQNNELALKNKKIAEAEKKMLETEIKIKKIKEKELEKEIEYKETELQNFAHYIVDKNKFIAKIQNDLIKIKKNISEKTINTGLQSVLIDISNKIREVRDNEEFLAYVDQINDNFYLKLKQRYKGITENEKRLASLLKMGLSSKEIASIMHITPKSVDTNRYRLRKKLNLSPDTNLSDFLKNI